jgi:Flp pilus assembly protein TadB
MALIAAVLGALAVALAVGRPRSGPLPGRNLDSSGAHPGRRGPQPADRASGLSNGLRVAVAVGAGATALMLVPGPTGLVVAGAASAAGWWRSGSLEAAATRRRRQMLEAELPHVVDLLLSVVAVGSAPGQALARVAEVAQPPMRAELAFWVRRLRLGADPAQVWREMSQHPQLGRLGRTLQRSAESGAPVLEALEHLAEDLRARRRTDVETRVRQVEVRASVPLGVCLLPAFVLVGVVPLVVGAAAGLLGTA